MPVPDALDRALADAKVHARHHAPKDADLAAVSDAPEVVMVAVTAAMAVAQAVGVNVPDVADAGHIALPAAKEIVVVMAVALGVSVAVMVAKVVVVVVAAVAVDAPVVATGVADVGVEALELTRRHTSWRT